MFEIDFPDVRDLGDRVLALGTLRMASEEEAGSSSETPVAFLVTYPGAAVHPCQGLRRPGASPRSRRAVGVGDVAGERRERPPGV